MAPGYDATGTADTSAWIVVVDSATLATATATDFYVGVTYVVMNRLPCGIDYYYAPPLIDHGKLKKLRARERQAFADPAPDPALPRLIDPINAGMALRRMRACTGLARARA